MFLGFFAWYRGLAIGPMTSVSQVQLSQPVFTLIWSALILGEVLTPDILVGGAVIIALAFTAVRARVSSTVIPRILDK
jgi:drug/metabolite transporter (DMT)-like permease